MRRDVNDTAQTIAETLPGLISGVELEFFAKANITNSQFITLMAIFYAGKCTMGYLAESLHVKMPTVTGLIDRLVKLDLVKRSHSEADRRKVFIELSKKGRVLIEEFKGVVRRRWTKILTALKPAEVRNFQKVLEKISSQMQRQKHGKAG